MHARWLVILAVSCGGGARPAPVVAHSADIAPAAGPTCSDAAAGLERATLDVRSPGASVWKPMRDQCETDAWSARAIACFASMQSEQLGGCAMLLPDEPRTALFAVLRDEHDTLAVARARLATVQVGVAECDQFVAAVANLLDCEQVPLDDRVRLGHETAELWDLPTTGLPPEAQQRMANTCGASLAKLQAEAQGAGCVR
jgi:hypothetical protein